MGEKTISVGLLGAGRIGRVHAASIAANPGARLAWVADPFINAAEEVAGQYGARATGDPAEVLADPDLDAVVVCTPTPTHVGFIIEAVQRGIAVLCEKPVDLDLATARSCRATVAGSAVPIMMGFNRRFDPSMREVREAVAAGSIGTLEQLTIISRDPAPAPLAYLEQSGGIFKDQSIHDLDMARSFLPDIVEVTAHGSNLFDAGIKGINDFDTVTITLRSASGALVTITNSRHCAAGHDQRLEAFGSAGLLEVGNDTGSLVRRSTADGTGTAAPFKPFFLERYAQAYALELDAFLGFIREGTTPAPGLEDGIAALELAEAAMLSVREKRTVAVSEIRASTGVGA